MNWEEIDDIAKRVATSIFAKLAGENGEQRGNEEDEVIEKLSDLRLSEEEIDRRRKYDGQKVFQRIVARRRKRMIVRVSAVACSLLCACCVLYMFQMTKVRENEEMLHTEFYGMRSKQQVVLSLSGGEQVVLGSKDTVCLQEGDKTIEVKEGKITYNAKSTDVGNQEVLYNTLSVPKGGEFQVKLSDGTVVYLNADSELRYPLSFLEKERRVYLKGEAWFEVSSDENMPFYVLADDVEVKVYGTSFNVNTYGRKVIQTVLVEGSVGIRSLERGQEILMKPGQLAEYDRSKGEIQLRKVDVSHYLAWRSGYFYFDDETLDEIMEELSRWYDMEVIFLSDYGRELHFSGFLQRYGDVRKILATITEAIGIKFEFKENKIIIN